MRLRETIDWGIDLGTTNSSIAVFEGRDVKVIKNNEGNEITPSAVYEKMVENTLVKRVGASAKQKLINDYEHVALEFKQCMGSKGWYFEFPSTGRKATAVDLSAEVLGELIRSVKQKEGEDIFSALITVPAAFSIPMYEATKKAGEQVGLKYVELLEEPIAAALAYGLKANPSRRVIWLAYDLGGGTFDAALVRMEDGVFTVFDHEGFLSLGGKHLDEEIIKRYLLPILPPKIKERVIPRESSPWWLLKMAAEEAKIQLSVKDSHTIETTIDGHDFVYTLTREQLDKLEDEKFSLTIEKCKKLLERNKFTSKDIEKVILIGGPTLSPHLRKMIEEGLQIPIDFSIDPLTAVARGAAIYAADRRIPDEVLDKIRQERGMKKEVSVHADLHYPPTTMEKEVMVTGTLESKKREMTISSKWSIEISRVDKAGNVMWRSGRIPIAENGGFARIIPLEEGENLFRLVVMDTQGRQVETDKDVFSIRVTIKSSGPELPRGIGVADSSGEVVVFFEKGQPLPAEKTIILKTTKELKRGRKGEAINIPVVEGNEKKAYLNWVIGTLKVEADNVHTNIPEESNVEVTIKIDESRSVQVSAWFEDYDVEATMPIDMGPDIEKLHEDINKIKKLLASLEDVKDEDQEISQIIEEVEEAKIIKDIEILTSQATKYNPEPALQAIQKLIELRKKLDPIMEKDKEIDEMLKEMLEWKAHKEWCDKNLQKAKNIVKEVGANLPPDWKRKFEQLLEKYDEAIKNKDAKRSEEIAYEKLPDLFLSSEATASYVGGAPGKKEIKEVPTEITEMKKTKGDTHL